MDHILLTTKSELFITSYFKKLGKVYFVLVVRKTNNVVNMHNQRNNMSSHKYLVYM